MTDKKTQPKYFPSPWNIRPDITNIGNLVLYTEQKLNGDITPKEIVIAKFPAYAKDSMILAKHAPDLLKNLAISTEWLQKIYDMIPECDLKEILEAGIETNLDLIDKAKGI